MKFRNQAATLITLLCIGCGGGSHSPTQPPPPPPPNASRASFTLDGAGYVSDVRTLASANGNLVFCRFESPAPDTVWIRLAQSDAADGETSAHIDIDLCHFAGSSTYTVLHSTTGPRTCSLGQSLGIWWHDGTRVFASQPGISGPCTVRVTRGAATIDGTFECSEIPPRSGGGERLEIRSGSFSCAF